MDKPTIGKIAFPISSQNQCDWSERQYDQLKNQILAYKYLIRYMTVPKQVIENIRSFSPEEWELSRKKQLEEVQEQYKEKFESQYFSMKELGSYFRQRQKEEEKTQSITSEINLKNEKEYVVESEIENRKMQLEKYLNNLKEIDENADIIKNIRGELQLLKAYYIQKNIRKDVILDFITEINK